MLTYGIASAGTTFAMRTSHGSRPACRAMASSTISIAKHTPVRATPRYGRIGGLFVAAANAWQRYFSITYGPGRIELTCADSRHAENG